MKSKAVKLLDMVLTYGLGNDRAVVLPEGGETAWLFGSYTNVRIPACLAVWREDKHQSAFVKGDGSVVIASDAMVTSKDGSVIDIYYFD